ncbi:KpsF/GutQ family sugar-phosphate isomerase [Caulobacter sp. KR2-114]|uniref:KpsF/GutQ family sugar-phosphate isomerase n=1 Tax=Caulobacter sp. KR2-114 TaxID=3400912 RepID=UPI003C06E229
MQSVPQAAAGEAGHAASAHRTLAAEIAGLQALSMALAGDLKAAFAQAVDVARGATGRIVVTGMGKSGHVARKVAATLASTGSPAFFLHPAEASHGDLGMLAVGDVVLALSQSGETPELKDVLQHCKRFAIPVIAMTAESASALAQAADVVLLLPRAEEACPNQLAPTTSTTMQMALGDALAIALLEARGFSPADFRTFHPGGRLGARLVTVGELMGRDEALPAIPQHATIGQAVVEISAKRYGGAAVVDAEGRLVGAFTDGDLRRALPQAGLDAPVAAHMTHAPVSVSPQTMASEALRVMNERPRPIMLLFVCEEDRLVGAVHMHDFLRAGIA